MCRCLTSAFISRDKHRDESRRGTHECVRHITARISSDTIDSNGCRHPDRWSNARFPDTHPSPSPPPSATMSRAEGPDRKRWFGLLEPVYSYIRIRWHCSNEDAKDLTQSFFAAALERNFFAGYDARKGTFRTFLRVCLDRFLANARSSRCGKSVRASGSCLMRNRPRRFSKESGRGASSKTRSRNCGRPLKRAGAQCVRGVRALRSRRGSSKLRRLAREFGITSTAVTNYLASARRNYENWCWREYGA